MRSRSVVTTMGLLDGTRRSLDATSVGAASGVVLLACGICWYAWKKKILQSWLPAGAAGAVLGAIGLIGAPGNFARYGEQGTGKGILSHIGNQFAGKTERMVIAEARRKYPGLAKNGDYTSIITPRHHARLVGAIEEARAGGATVLSLDDDGTDAFRKIPPTVIIDAPEDCGRDVALDAAARRVERRCVYASGIVHHRVAYLVGRVGTLDGDDIDRRRE